MARAPEAEHDNLRAALSWTLEQREAEPARLAGALWRFWITRGYYEEGRRWFEGALEKGERTAARARVLAGWVTWRLGRATLAERRHRPRRAQAE